MNPAPALSPQVAFVAATALVVALSCALSSTKSPWTQPDADRDIRVVVVVQGEDAPTTITIDGEVVCGARASPCPGTGFLEGGAEGRMTVFVAPGTHEFSIQIPKMVGGTLIDENERFILDATPDTTYLCHVEDGCAPWDPSDGAPAVQESTASEVECRLNSDCDPGLQCVIGACVPLCREDRDCAKGQICRPGPGRYDECLEVLSPV